MYVKEKGSSDFSGLTISEALPDGLKESVSRILSNLYEKEGVGQGVFLGRDGRFCQGILAGKAGKNKEAEFVGLLARKKRREQKIGQLRTAALELIPFILDSGADIFYSGDIDPDGIGIADRLWQKFGSRIHMWRMSSADYAKSLSNEEIGDSGISKLGNIKNPVLRETAEQLKLSGKAGDQENLLEDLQEDIAQ